VRLNCDESVEYDSGTVVTMWAYLWWLKCSADIEKKKI
jgi:hypothetical protein